MTQAEHAAEHPANPAAANPAANPATGRLTLPVETGIDEEIKALLQALGADAVRNSDGTELPELVKELSAKVYSTYFPARGDQDWAADKPHTRVHQFLMSAPATCLESGQSLRINPIAGYFARQLQVELGCDTARYWEVIDRTSGERLEGEKWRLVVKDGTDQRYYAPGQEVEAELVAAEPAPFVEVEILQPQAGHRYTVGFLARQIWDSTQMYNYLTNDWENEPARVREYPYDVRLEEVWGHVRTGLGQWLAEHPEVDVVRFTTFFYHFTIAYGQLGQERASEKFVDWFGYSGSVSVPALEAFAQEYGYHLTPEDFIDAGYYHCAHRQPTQRYADWLDFTQRFVAERAKELVEAVHAQGREAMMFLGDNWIGCEPYGKYFGRIGLDAVVGSVGSAATCRMISDIPHVRYTEGRFLPYFFPDVFRPGGDPLGEARQSWIDARRAICRRPLDRMGYGGYLSLALKFPEFLREVEAIVGEFRQICAAHQAAAGSGPGERLRSGAACAPFKVAVLNAWGQLRSWQAHMVSHAQWYRQTYSYLGVLEALAGLPVEVQFLSFADFLRGELDPQVKVIINAGGRDSSYSGGEAWNDPRLQAALRDFVAGGGGLLGVGHPTAKPSAAAADLAADSIFALADVFGVDLEMGWGLCGRYPAQVHSSHFITADLSLPPAKPGLGGPVADAGTEGATQTGPVAGGEGERGSDLPDPNRPMGLDPAVLAALPTFESGEDCGYIKAVDPATAILARRARQQGALGLAGDATLSIDLAAHHFGQGRAVYLAGLPYSAENSRLLHRALYWAAGAEEQWGTAENPDLVSDNVWLEVCHFAGSGQILVCNNDLQRPQSGKIRTPQGLREVTLVPGGSQWLA